MVTRIGKGMIQPGTIGADELFGGGSTLRASGSSLVAGTSEAHVLTPKAVFDAASFVPVEDGATITLDLSDGLNFTVTLGGNRTIADPVNVKVGQCGIIEIVQDATGNRTVTFGSAWKFSGGSAPALSTAANARDLLSYFVLPGGDVFAALVEDVR